MKRKRSRDEGQGAQSRTEGWIAPPPRAALVTAAMKVGLWGLVACGPVALLSASAGPASSEGGPATTEARRSEAGPSGFAELYVAAYLRAGNGDASLKAFFPGAPAISNPQGQRAVSRTVTTDAREVDPGYWSITVAADVAAKDDKGTLVATGVHYFRVAVIASGDPAGGGTKREGTAAGYVATELPAEVAAPAPGPAPDLAYDTQRQISSGPLADTVRQALAAYLSGAGDLSRYLSPGAALGPVTPAPYRQVELSGITLSKNLPDVDTTVPADRTRARLLAKVEVTDAAGRSWPLTYALTVTARAGRWELSALDDAPALSTPKAPPTSPQASLPNPGTETPTAPSGSASPQTPQPEPTGEPGQSPSMPSATPGS